MPIIKRHDSSAIQQVLEAAGVEFLREIGGRGVPLRQAEP